MKTIRNSVFETNSSSCHVVTVLSEYDMDRLGRDQLLLAINKSQNEKTIAQPYDSWNFGYEIERCKFGYNYGEEKQEYCDLPNDKCEELSNKLWKVLIDQAHGKIDDLSKSVGAVLDKYDVTTGFRDRVYSFCCRFADKYELNEMLDNLQIYKMSDGEVMHMSCHEFEC